MSKEKDIATAMVFDSMKRDIPNLSQKQHDEVIGKSLEAFFGGIKSEGLGLNEAVAMIAVLPSHLFINAVIRIQPSEKMFDGVNIQALAIELAGQAVEKGTELAEMHKEKVLKILKKAPGPLTQEELVKVVYKL